MFYDDHKRIRTNVGWPAQEWHVLLQRLGIGATCPCTASVWCSIYVCAHTYSYVMNNMDYVYSSMSCLLMISVDEDAFTHHLVSVFSFIIRCWRLHGNEASLQNSTSTMTRTTRPVQVFCIRRYCVRYVHVYIWRISTYLHNIHSLDDVCLLYYIAFTLTQKHGSHSRAEEVVFRAKLRSKAYWWCKQPIFPYHVYWWYP